MIAMDSYILNDLATAAHNNAVRHGFYNDKPTNEHLMMLVITEIAEAVQADRSEPGTEINARDRFEEMVADGYAENDAYETTIKGTKFDELADVCIRLLDMAGEKGIDFTKMNPCRYHRAFDKYSFTENAFGLAKGLWREPFSIERRIQFGIHYVQEWCYAMDESIEWFINKKMAYNQGREYMHGKKY